MSPADRAPVAARRRWPVSVSRLVLIAALASPAVTLAQGAGSRPVHGPAIAMYGDLKYQPGFSHFDYTNPEAPKGGDVRLAAFGTYDTLNPFTLKGVPAAGLGEMFDSLMVGS